MKVLVDFHHTELFRGFIHLFEKRYGWKMYRPCGREWYDKGYYYHPIPEEALGNLTRQCELKEDEKYVPAEVADTLKFRWMTLEEARNVDLIVCSTDRNQDGFYKLRQDLGLKCKIVRYIGNVSERVEDHTFDVILPATLHYWNLYKDRKPSILYHPEIDLDIFKWTEPPDSSKSPYLLGNEEWKVKLPVMRTFMNFIYHSGSGSDKGEWNRYRGYASQLNFTFITHGLGTPPPGVPVELDKIIDIWFRENPQYTYLLDRSKWPSLDFNDGEPLMNSQIARLMSLTNMVWHLKRCDGYGYIIHQVAASGRPVICEERNYSHLSFGKLLTDGQTCVYITGDNEADKKNLRDYFLNPERCRDMGKELHRRFHENINFDDEARKIKELL